MKIEYSECHIDRIMNFFAANFKLPKDQKLSNFEVTYDQRTGKVIFKLYIEENNSTIKK